MSIFYKRIYHLIALHLPSLFSFFSSSKLLYSISHDPYFWKQKLFSDYPRYSFSDENYKQNYITMHTSKYVYAMGNNLYSQLGSENPINIYNPIKLNIKAIDVISVPPFVSFILGPDKNLYGMGNLQEFFSNDSLPEKTNGMYKIFSNVERLFDAKNGYLYLMLSDKKLYSILFSDKIDIVCLDLTSVTDYKFPYCLKDGRLSNTITGTLVCKNVRQFDVKENKILFTTFDGKLHCNINIFCSLNAKYAKIGKIDKYGFPNRVYLDSKNNLYIKISGNSDFKRLDSDITEFHTDQQGTIITIKNKQWHVIQRDDTGPAKHFMFLL